MKNTVKIFIITLAVLFFVFLLSCTDTELPRDRIFYDYFDTVTVITGYESDADTFDSVCGELETLISRQHKLFDIYNCYDGINNVKTINDNAGVNPVEVDGDIIALLEFSRQMYDDTGGMFNPAMGAVLSIWHDYRERAVSGGAAELPPEELLSAAALHCDFDDVIIDAGAGTVFIADSDMTLDLGAVAKGYTARLCAELLRQLGCDGYAVSLGGTVVTVGGKPDGGWRAGIENPDAATSASAPDYAAVLELRDMSLVTSGSYQRYYMYGGVRYHHIINPDTLMPENIFTSVSILTRDAAVGDALSTAVFNMSYEDGIKYIEAMPDTEAMWIFPDGDIASSSGFDAYRIK